MIEKENYKSFLPADLYAQIEEICSFFHDLQSEASGILHNSKVPDASAQLNDVLASTEEATHVILNMAGEIQTFGEGAATKDQINACVTRIYEACNFQDVSGQRIKKVLLNLSLLEARLMKLSETAKTYTGVSDPVPVPETSVVCLENGPQLSSEAASQADIDKLFGSL